MGMCVLLCFRETLRITESLDNASLPVGNRHRTGGNGHIPVDVYLLTIESLKTSRSNSTFTS